MAELDHVQASVVRLEPTTEFGYYEFSLELDEIRLLELQPAEQLSEPIRCRLIKAVLSNLPPYEALSYVWGDPNETFPIEVNRRSFHVTTNLLAGLKHIRRQRSSVWLWIDAICINQHNIPERNHQVQLMRQIYMKAKQTLIWLGKGYEDSDLAMDLIRRWSIPLPPQTPRSMSIGVVELLRTVRDPFEVRAWEALRHLFARSYWARSWILQEIVFSERAMLICGFESVPYEALELAQLAWVQLSQPENFRLLDFSQIRLVTISNYNAASTITLHRHMRRTNAPVHSAFALIRYTRSLKATDPRDKIYSLLGFEEIKRLELKVDYDKPVQTVYGDLVRAYLTKERKLDILCQAGIGWPSLQTELDLPSWIPDFRDSVHRSPAFSTFCAAESGLPAATISEDMRVLTARGVIYDTIRDIDYHEEGGNDVKTFWQDLALSQPGLHPTRIPYLQAYFRTVIADNSGHGNGELAFKDEKSETEFFDNAAGMMWCLGQWALKNDKVFPGLRDRIGRERAAMMVDMNDYIQNFLLWSGHIPEVMTKQALLAPFLGEPGSESQLKFPDDDNKHRGRHCSAVYLHSIAYSTVQRSFFVTKKGYLGLAPQAAKRDDLICVLFGCDEPLIIRKIGCHYVLIGDSYIYGIMNGEVLQEMRKGCVEAQDIIFH
ncbi:heterokaryon incompatibility protein-domain-containing protein [Hyaloscypha sp. PMI_1271]|nr:heterokaryon incompatibility protein-domain-containing protein [Hyaloscypha sp. PMI_1271]